MKNTPFSPFFRPKGIVLSGVSQDPNKLGYFLARNLYRSGYPGSIHYVNPRGGALFGQSIYTSISSVPDPVDLAVLLVPPPAVPEAMEEVGKRGIKTAIVATGGFKETGPEGAALEEKVKQIADSFGIRFVGPNCVGIINTHYPFDTTFLQPPGPPTGEIAFLSHSGAICAAVIDWIRGHGMGVSHLISLGNQTSVNEVDLLPEIAADPHTSVITLYLEGVKAGQRFIDVAAETVKSKPIIALKVGRYDSGKKAAASHTGALAGQESAFDAAFERAGVLRADTTEELFQWAKALAWSPLPKGNRVAVLTNSGGPGVTAADAIELNKMKLAELSEHTVAELKKFLPAAASLHNPVDMLASATDVHFAQSLKLLLEDEQVDAVIVISPPPPPSTAGAIVKAMLPVVQSYDKPVIFTLMGSDQITEGVSLARAARIPEYRFPEWSASALGALMRYAAIRARKPRNLPRFAGVNLTAAKNTISSSVKGNWMDPAKTLDLLESYRIPVVRLSLARSVDEAVTAAKKLGYPLVMKLASEDIPHKSDIGGVLLGIQNEKAVRDSYQTIMDRAKKAKPDARIDGINLQKMLGSGQEVITGFIRDPQFGPMMMFGSGGVEVEGLKDVAFSLAPLTREDAEKLLASTWAGKKLNGFRSISPVDREAVIDVLLRLSRLAADLPEIFELEINPLRVMEKGGTAIDVRAKVL